MTRKQIGSRLAVAAVAAALAACGESDSGGTNGPTDPTGQQVVVSGRLAGSTTWTADNTYLLRGAVFVDPGATLTIQAGTRVFAEKSSLGTLVVARGGRLIARGTAAAPIVMTSDQPVGRRARGDWGGLILNGSAPINVPGGQASGEGDTGLYGGDNVNDSSGELQYLRVEFAGIEFSPDNELNGIAFQGTGAGTLCDHLQVHFNQDDGFEWFGGSTSCKYLVSSFAGDDSFDWTHGWIGRGQFWVGVQKGDAADSGFESDNFSSNNDALPRSNPTLFNISLIGAPGTQDGTRSANGMVLRAGTAGMLRNFIVTGFKQNGIDIRDSATFNQFNSGALSIDNAIVFGNGGSAIGSANGNIVSQLTNGGGVAQVDPRLTDPFNLGNPNFTPIAGSPALTLPAATPPNDGFFEPGAFIGAMGATDWTRGWTTFVAN